MNVTLFLISIYVLTAIIIIAVLNIMQNHNNKKIKKQLEKLEIEKNKIDSTPITPELSKIESYLKNDKLEMMYSGWKTRLDDIKQNQIPKISDLLLEAEYSMKQSDYKNVVQCLKVVLVKLKVLKTK